MYLPFANTVNPNFTAEADHLFPIILYQSQIGLNMYCYLHIHIYPFWENYKSATGTSPHNILRLISIIPHINIAKFYHNSLTKERKPPKDHDNRMNNPALPVYLTLCSHPHIIRLVIFLSFHATLRHLWNAALHLF